MNRIFVLIIWVICVTATIAAVVMAVRGALHPLAESGEWSVTLVSLVPYVLFAGAAWLLRRHSWMVILLIVASAFTALLLTTALYQNLTLWLFVLDGRAAGKHGMACGPPAIIFVLPVAYLISVLAIGVGLVVQVVELAGGYSTPEPGDGPGH